MTKFTVLILILISSCTQQLSSQNNCDTIKSMINSIKELPAINKGDTLYWNIVKQGKAVMPCLIDLVKNDDKTVLYSPNSLRNYFLGDVSYSLMSDIIVNIPVQALLKNINCNCSTDIGFINYWICLDNIEKRREFANELLQWYENNSDKLVWVETNLHNYRDIMDEFHPYINPAGGYYIIGK